MDLNLRMPRSGTVNLASSERGPDHRSNSSGTRDRVPNEEGASSQHPLVGCPQQVSSDTEEILGDSVHRQESLGLSRGFEPSHSSLPLSGRLVRDFCPIVRVSAGVMDNGRHDRSLRGGIAPQLVGDQSSGLASLAFQQLTEETFSGTPIATRLDEDVNHVAVLVDSTPEIVLLALDGYEESHPSATYHPGDLVAA